ncbi:DUF1963 domain-containing protein [Priestia filamentosa]
MFSMNNKIKLPQLLESHRKEIENTIKPVVRIEGKKGITSLWQSKFRGKPYLPKEIEHPTGKDGTYLTLAAQINFEEVPQMPGFPTKGILQFYIDSTDDLLGANFEDETDQAQFRILYHEHVLENIENIVTDFRYLDDVDTTYFPLSYEALLSFTPDIEPVSERDYRVEELSFDLYEEIEDGVELWELYAENTEVTGSKIGGYPFFTQEDPRVYEQKYREHNILLLQIDTDTELDIMWGDSGVCNFFIRKEDLEKRDFSNVMYNWDCY